MDGDHTQKFQKMEIKNSILWKKVAYASCCWTQPVGCRRRLERLEASGPAQTKITTALKAYATLTTSAAKGAVRVVS